MLNLFGKDHRTCDGMNRRNFLSVGALGAVGGMSMLTLPDLLRARAQAQAQGTATRDASVVWLWLGGGATHVETFDPKMSAPEEFRSTVGAVKHRTGTLRRGRRRAHDDRTGASARSCSGRARSTGRGRAESGRHRRPYPRDRDTAAGHGAARRARSTGRTASRCTRGAAGGRHGGSGTAASGRGTRRRSTQARRTRRFDGTLESACDRVADRPRAGASGAQRRGFRAGDVRPRSLQADQRYLGPRRRRRGTAPRSAPRGRGAACRRQPRTLWRRGIHCAAASDITGWRTYPCRAR